MKEELRKSMLARLLVVAFGVLVLQACADGGDEQGIEERGLTLDELLLRDARTCEYNPDYPQELIDGLSNQLIEELRCLNPNWLEFYESCQDVGCINANGPQPLAARPEVLVALRAAASAEGDYISINAAYRDVAMQYFSRWYKENCNSSFPAAIPGNSNHQGGRAIDVNFYNFWWDALIDAGFEHPLVNDNPHFELVGDATFRNESEQLKSLGVLAFQRLWNRNFPSDPIGEDGVYGENTKQRLGNSPVAGFLVGACEIDDGGDDATDGDTDAVDAMDAEATDADAGIEVDGDSDTDTDIDSDTGPDTDTEIDGIGDAGDSQDASIDGTGDASDMADSVADAGNGSDTNQDGSADAAGPSGDAAGRGDGGSSELRDRLVFGGGGGGGCSSAADGTADGTPTALGGLLTLFGFLFFRRRNA